MSRRRILGTLRTLRHPSQPGWVRWSSTLDIQLRQYQEECIAAVLAHLQAGAKRLGISLATGAGKTVVFSHLIDRVPARRATATAAAAAATTAAAGDQTLILVHRRELVEQAVRHCTRANPGKRIEVEMGAAHASGHADITVASVQSLTSGERLRKFAPDRFKLVLVDEAHHIVARSYRAVLQHMGLGRDADHAAAPALVGVSATFSRFDGLQLGAAIDHIVYHKDYVDMIGEKWLSDLIFTTVKSHVDLSVVKNDAFGDYNLASLSRACNTREANDITVRTWLSKARTRKSTLVFCVDTRHVAELAAAFRRHNVDARYVLGSDRTESRAAKLDDFKNGQFPVMLNCGVFTEGTDIPNIDCVLLARPTRSRNLLVQMIGRGMRLSSGKTDCHVIDMVASLNTGIVTTPTLFGLDPDHILDGTAAVELKRSAVARTSESAAQGAPISKVTFTEYTSVHDLLSDHADDRHIRRLSQNAWVNVGEDRYVLVNRRGEYVTIEADASKPNGPIFRVRCNEKIPRMGPTNKWIPMKRAETVAAAETFEAAVRAADTFLANKDSFERFIILASARWRKAPCTNEQLEFLNRTIGKSQPLNQDDLTKGQAADMITKVKFGARGRFDKLMTTAKRAKQSSQRIEALRRRESVEVGPMNAD